MPAEPQRCGVVVLAAEWGGRGAAFARELARRGHRVAHVSPSLIAGGTTWQPLSAAADGGPRRVALPSDRAGHAGEPWSPADLVRAWDALMALVDELGLRCPAVLVQSAGWRHLAGCASERTDFPLVCDLTPAQALEAPSLVARCDLVLARSGPAAERLRELQPHVMTVPDGCDAEGSRRSGAAAPLLRPPLSGPLIGYAGDGPLDARLLVALAELRPDWAFPILTEPPPDDLELLDRLANVYVLDRVPATERARYVAELDVGLVAHRTTSAALERTPVEALDLLAAGKPVVATTHPDLFALQPAGIAIGATPLELAAAIERALSGSHDAEAGRAAAAAASWHARAALLGPALESLVPSLDVVVVSYDNAEAIARCLGSIERDGSHAARLIVVDNASGPETQAILDRAEAGGAIVERLAANAGFPTAANRGIALGTGRYVLILNDDVQLPAGGLLALVHALARSRDVGLAGPATNRIANEARVAVPYDDRHPPDAVVDGVHAARAAAHAGVAFDMRVAALFAAIARRADLEAVGGLSERYQLGQYDDDDLSHRIRTQLGLRVVCSDDVFVHHAGMSAFAALDPHLLDSLVYRNLRVFERATRTTWQPHRLRDEEHPTPMEHDTVNDPSQQDAAVRIAELEAELEATRRDHRQQIGELARRAGAGNGASRVADGGLYELLLRLERERQEVHTSLHAEHHKRLDVEAEREAAAQDALAVRADRDALAVRLAELRAEHARLAGELDESRRWSIVLEERSRRIESSFAFRVGRAIVDPLKRLPGARSLARVARRAR